MPSRDAFLFLQGITTEDNPIELTFFQFGEDPRPGSSSIKKNNSFNITKKSDDFTPILFHKLADQSSILFGSATVPVVGSDTAQNEHRFGNLLVSSFQQSGSTGPDTTEIVGFTFETISTEFTDDP